MVARQLWKPIIQIRFRLSPAVNAVRVLVAVPKTAMHENDFPAWTEDEIRLSGKVTPMQPVAIAQTVDDRAHHHFRLHVFAFDPAHIFRAPLGRQLVGHPSRFQIFP